MAAILLACRAVAALQPQDAEPSRDLQGFVNEMRSTQRLPGLAVVVVRSDGQPRVYVSGERRIGKGDPITRAIEPAGDVSLSPQDYGRFLQLHWRGLRGRDEVLKRTTFQDLHRRAAPINPSLGFAMGCLR